MTSAECSHESATGRHLVVTLRRVVTVRRAGRMLLLARPAPRGYCAGPRTTG